jgi:hypothetical protein
LISKIFWRKLNFLQQITHTQEKINEISFCCCWFVKKTQNDFNQRKTPDQLNYFISIKGFLISNKKIIWLLIYNLWNKTNAPPPYITFCKFITSYLSYYNKIFIHLEFKFSKGFWIIQLLSQIKKTIYLFNYER